MDIWQSENTMSPGSPVLCRDIRKVINRWRDKDPLKKGKFVERKMQPHEPPAEETSGISTSGIRKTSAASRKMRRQRAQERQDEEFFSLSFEDLLRQEIEEEKARQRLET